jgi:hypothetical protein
MTIGMSILLLVGGYVVTRGGDDLRAPVTRIAEREPTLANAPTTPAPPARGKRAMPDDAARAGAALSMASWRLP